MVSAETVFRGEVRCFVWFLDVDPVELCDIAGTEIEFDLIARLHPHDARGKAIKLDRVHAII